MNKKNIFTFLSWAILVGFIYWNYNTIYSTKNAKMDANILSFKFEAENNKAINSSVEGQFNESGGIIFLNMQSDIDLQSLEPTIVFNSNGFNYLPKGAQDFTKPVIYTITNQNGLEIEYKVLVVNSVNYESKSYKNYLRYLIRYLKRL